MSWAVTAAWAAAGMGAHSARVGGEQQSKDAKSQAKAALLDARIAEFGVDQTAARRTEALLADLGAIRAHRASQNVEASSGSAVAAEKGYESDYLQTLRADILSQRYGIVQKQTEAAGLRGAARSAKVGGYATAATSIVGAFGSLGKTKPPAKT